MLKSNFGIEDGDTDADVTDKIKRALAILGIDEASTLPVPSRTVIRQRQRNGNSPYEPGRKEDRILHSLQRLVVKGSERRP